MKDETWNAGLVGSIGAWHGRKRNKKLLRGSRTPGNGKGKHCMASQLDKYMVTRGRSYKHRDYQSWKAAHSGRKSVS